MKKVIIVSSRMTVGGCEKALISMLKAIPKDKYKITLLLMSREGELYEEIPEWVDVKVIPHVSDHSRDIISDYVAKARIFKAVQSIFYLCLLRFAGYFKQLYYYTKALPELSGYYDLAVSYFFPAQLPDWYVMNNIRAAKKAVWVHSDVSKLDGINVPLCHKMYSKYDNIFCVSRDSADKFIGVFPELKNKVSVFYNIISKERILSLGNTGNGFEDEFDGIRILTVGRVSKEKGQDLIPGVLSKLLGEGYNVRWYCIGDGSLRKNLQAMIGQNRLSNNLLLLGNKTNPYPYMKQCNIYVQPSRYEAYCTTVCEVRCFNKPIVCTDVAGAREQITDMETGFVVDINEEELCKRIKEILDNRMLGRRFCQNLKKDKINTSREIEKLYKVIG